MKILHSKVLWRYILSYLTLLAVVVMGVAATVSALRRTARQVTDEGNHLVLNQYKAMMDVHFEMLVKISEQFLLDEAVQEQMLRQGDIRVQDRYEMVLFSQHIHELLQTYSYSLLEEIFLYFPGTQSVVTSGARVGAPLFFSELYRFGDMNAAQAASLMQESWKSRYMILRDIPCVNQVTGERCLCIARALDRSAGADSGVVVFLISQRKLEGVVAGLSDAGQCDIYLCDREGRSLFFAQEDALLSSGEVSLAVDSDTFDARYCLISNYPGLTAIIRGAEEQVALLLALAAVAGVAVSFFLAYSNYRPIRSLWSQSPIPQQPEDAFRNELRDITSQMKAIVDQNLQQHHRLADVLPVYTGRLLMDFVHGSIGEDEVDWEMLAEYGIQLEPPRLMVMILAIEGGETPLAQAVADTAQQVFRHLGGCYLLPGGDIYLLLNLREEVQQQNVRQTAEELQQLLLHERELTVTFALGSMVTARGEVWRSFAQAERALEYAYTGSPLQVLCFWELPDRRRVSEFLQDYDMRLLSSIRSGNVSSVEALLDELFAPEEGTLPYSEAEVMMLHVLEKCARAAQQLNVALPLPEGSSLLAQLQKCRHVSQFKQLVLGITRTLAQEAEQGHQQDERLKSAVIRLIESRYADPNLNVSQIAGQLGLSQSYLSTHFKRQTGIGAADYIHLVRIRHAKEMMADPAASLSQIARQAGYVSDATFIRSFKKYEGITPGAFRKNFVASEAAEE